MSLEHLVVEAEVELAAFTPGTTSNLWLSDETPPYTSAETPTSF